MKQNPNIQIIQFSDEPADLISQQTGRTFTEESEKLVTRCVWEIPAWEKKLEAIREQIRQEEERLWKLQKADKEQKRLEQNIQSARHCFGIVERRAKAMLDRRIRMLHCCKLPDKKAASLRLDKSPSICYDSGKYP